MTKTQLEAMIKFHRKAEQAYRAFGQLVQAEQAARKAEELEAQLKEMELK